MCISHFCQRTCWQRANCLSDMAAGVIPGTTCLYLLWHHRVKILCVHRADAWHPCMGLLVFISEGFPSFKKIKSALLHLLSTVWPGDQQQSSSGSSVEVHGLRVHVNPSNAAIQQDSPEVPVVIKL